MALHFAPDLRELTLNARQLPPLLDELLAYLVSVRSANLRSLTLLDNSCPDADVWHRLLRALGANVSLDSLHIRWNGLGDECGEALGELVRVNRLLARLDLRGNGLSAAGVAPLLERGSRLTALDLSWNAIGDAGAAQVAALVGRSRLLAELTLERCAIGEEGGRALAEAAAASAELVQLDLRHNPVPAALLTRIGVALRARRTSVFEVGKRTPPRRASVAGAGMAAGSLPLTLPLEDAVDRAGHRRRRRRAFSLGALGFGRRRARAAPVLDVVVPPAPPVRASAAGGEGPGPGPGPAAARYLAAWANSSSSFESFEDPKAREGEGEGEGGDG